MSYCVHCGVKLAPSETRCPLCQTPVVDPVTPYDPSVPKEFPTRVREQHLEINPGATLVLAAILLAVPSLICLFVDLLVSGGLTWSPYPIGAFLMIFCAVLPPVLCRRNPFLWSVVVDDAALCLYLWMVEALNGGAWFHMIVFPVLLLLGVMLLAMAASIHQGILQGLGIPAVGLLLICVVALTVDLLITVTLTDQVRITWSAFVMIPCGIIAAMLIVIHRNNALRSELKRKLHL